MNFFSSILMLVIVLISLCYIYTGVVLTLSNFEWGVFFVSLMLLIIVINRLNSISIVSITSLLTLTIMLFLGGRFFVAFIKPNTEIFQLLYLTDFYANSAEATRLFFLVISGIFSLQLGQYLTFFKKPVLVNCPIRLPQKNIQTILLLIFPIILLAIGNVVYYKILDVLTLGYTGLYKTQSQSQFSSTSSSILNTFFYVFVGIAFAYGTTKQKYLFLILLFLYSTVMLVLGARASFGAFLLFLLWIYGDFGQKQISILKLLLFAIISIILINYIVEISGIRNINTGAIFTDRIYSFLYSQGITLMVFDISMTIENYPTLAYMQSFIPGSSFITSLFTKVFPPEINFANYLASSLNNDLFLQGNGLGWSIFSDFYLFSGRIIFLYCLLFVILGYTLCFLEKQARYSNFIQGLLVTLCAKILYIPRSGTVDVIPIAIYYVVTYIVLFTILRSINVLKRN